MSELQGTLKDYFQGTLGISKGCHPLIAFGQGLWVQGCGVHRRIAGAEENPWKLEIQYPQGAEILYA